MKKLMMLAAIAAVGSVFADCKEQDPANSAEVYDFKFTGKTTAGYKLADGKGGPCGEEGVAGGYVRVPGSLNIQGWIVICEPACDKIQGGDYTCSASWMTKPYKCSSDWTKADPKKDDTTFAFDLMNVIGKKQADAETQGKFSRTFYITANDTQKFELQFAGLGKYDKKNDRFTSFKGNFASTAVEPSWYVSSTVCAKTEVYDCKDLATLVPDVNTMAYGSWSLKYNSSASKKAAKGTYPKAK